MSRPYRPAVHVIVAVIALCTASARGQLLFVDDDAAPGGDGAGWATAFRFLQDALTLAEDLRGQGDTEPIEIRVAGGTHRPDESEAAPNGTGDPDAVFNMLADLSITGGWAGDPDDPTGRDIDLYETVLSGDLLGDDGPGFTNRGDNAKNVVAVTLVRGVGLDGLTIQGGDAGWGGGVICHGPQLEIRSCRFENNRATRGGAVYLSPIGDPDSWFRCFETVFTGNEGQYGGAFGREADVPCTFVRCSFIDNAAKAPDDELARGGAIDVTYAGPPLTLLGCEFTRNTASGGSRADGGAVHASCELVAIDCMFRENRCEGPDPSHGGALYLRFSEPKLVLNCSITGNSASGLAGGVYMGTSAFGRITNSIVWGNDDGAGSDESAQIGLYDEDVDLALAYSCVQGLTGRLGGTGNIGLDPRFEDAASGDLRLRAGSPCIDAGDNGALPPDREDLDEDGDTAEPHPVDHDGNARRQDDEDVPDTGAEGCFDLDMGAFEVAGVLPGARVVYIGPPDGSWLDPAHWQGGSVPRCEEIAVVSSSVVIDGDADVRELIVAPGGDVRIASGALDLIRLTVLPAGRFTLDDPGARVTVRSIESSGDVVWNAGDVEISYGTWTHQGQLTLGVTGEARLTLIGEARIEASTIEVRSTGTVVGNGSFVSRFVNGGRLEPGFGLGRISITGQFEQLATGTLAIDLAEMAPGMDTLEVSGKPGSAFVDGTLEIAILDDLAVANGLTFDVLLATTADVAAATIVGPTLERCRTFDFVAVPGGARIEIVPANMPRRIFVDADVTTAQPDGRSWASAYADLQDALDAACARDQIWVAAGTYFPSRRTVRGNDRSKTFLIPNEVAVIGGFEGTERTIDERAGLFDQTILSGDLAMNDPTGDDFDRFAWPEPNDPAYLDNVHHVVTMIEVNNSAVLDGLTITRGHSSGEGGGVYLSAATPTISRCRFLRNFSPLNGGAIVMRSDGPPPGGSPAVLELHDSVFLENRSRAGGALFLYTSGHAARVTGCSFIRNVENPPAGTGGFIGAGVYIGAPTEMTGCVFDENYTRGEAGALHASRTLTLDDCRFTRNEAELWGGALVKAGSWSLRLSACTFSGNIAPIGSGAAWLSGPIEARDGLPDGLANGADLRLEWNGSSVASAFVPGDYTQIVDIPASEGGGTGSLEIDFTGTGSGGWDTLTVEGTASLAGLLDVQFGSQFEPSAGDAFPFLGAASIESPFDVSLFEPLNDPQLVAVVRYGPASGLIGGQAASVVIDTLGGLLGFDDPLGSPVVPAGTSGEPVAAVLADLDGDDLLDLAVALPGAGDGAFGAVVILLNAGLDAQGEWAGWKGTRQFTVGVDPTSIAAGDFDGVNGIDLVVTNGGDGNVSILLNDGSATIFDRTDVPVGNDPSSVAVFDVNDDGILDLAVANQGDNAPQILRGDGNGTFPDGFPVPGIDRPGMVVPSLLDEDKDVDGLVVANRGDARSVTVLINNGGAFDEPIVLAVGGDPSVVTTRDLNDDGKTEIVSTSLGTQSGEPDTVSVISYSGGRAFGPAIEFEVVADGTPRSLTIVDVENDGDGDIAVVVRSGSQSVVRVLRNDTPRVPGGGATITLTGPFEEDAGDEPRLVLAGDVDDDGLDDLVVVNAESSGGAGAPGPDGPEPTGLAATLLNDYRCRSDVDGDGEIGFEDLLEVLFNWGPCGPPCPSDIDGDGEVGFADLLAVLFHWGPCA